ncbi:hypothetical protein LguiA_022603 [Lonicera macranthoides]
MKKEDGVLASIQPKKLFKDGEKSVSKKPLKQLGRVVSSRYSQSTVQSTGKSATGKSFLPENDEDGIKMFNKKRPSSVGKSELVVGVNGNLEVEESPISLTVIADKLPRIRTLRCDIDSSRDSGPVKRVAELDGKKSFFSEDEDEVPLICQALSFDEVEEE